MSCRWLVELERGVWLSDGQGDPPRTLQKKYAKVFSGKAKAQEGIEAARKHRRFPKARIFDTQYGEFI